jgi:hypothetical protein
MISYIFYVEDEWCYLNVYIKNNIYWIDWELYYYDIDTNPLLRKVEQKRRGHREPFNILCIKDNDFYYYNIDNKTINDLSHIKCDNNQSLIKNLSIKDKRQI